MSILDMQNYRTHFLSTGR